jgi:alpha-glucosidase
MVVALCVLLFSGGVSDVVAQGTKSASVHATGVSSAAAKNLENWWKNAVIYEIYPRSFQDSNGDGVGDLNGITSRLDYLKSLGVDAIWLTPCYPSPQVDFGYDISDYEAIDPQYGTMADFDRLVAEAKKRNIRVIMDMVMNHSSDQHKWFLESKSSKDNPKRNWYVWKDGKGETATSKGEPPNNWESLFGHSAWQWDPTTRQYYYHKFYIQQPDFNWNNPEVEKAFDDILLFWMKKGVAGFRFDAITTLFEDPDWIDEKELKDKDGKSYKNAYGDVALENVRTDNLPELHTVVAHFRELEDSVKANTFPGKRIMIGETYLPTIGDLARMYGTPEKPEFELPMDTQVGFINKLDVDKFRTKLNEVEAKIGNNVPLLVFDNHDNPRLDVRYGDGVHDTDIERVISTILFASRDASLFYYGDEIGMRTTPPTRKEDVKDPIGITGWPKEKGRDGERTPMQWDNSEYAGFSTVKPWLPVPPNKATINVKAEQSQPNSLLKWYEALIQLKKTNPALAKGEEIMLDTENKQVLSWLRLDKSAGSTPRAVVVATNFTAEPQQVSLDLFDAGVRAHRMKTLLETPEKTIHPPVGQIELDSTGRAETFVRAFQVQLPPYGVYIGEVQ